MSVERDLDDTPESDTAKRGKKPQSPLAVQIQQIRKSSPYKMQTERFKKQCSQKRNSDGTRGARCALCGNDINYRIKAPHPDSFSVDHIVPVKLRPDLIMDLNNWQPAHRGCNSAKGDDDDPLAPGSLGVPSEDW